MHIFADGNRSEESKYINEYPPDQKSNPPRRNTFGKWHSFKKIEEIRDEGKNIIGYKQEYDFVDNQGNKNGVKMREYTQNTQGVKKKFRDKKNMRAIELIFLFLIKHAPLDFQNHTW